jgi:hypothetical protein
LNEEIANPCRVLMAEGEWLVPEAERPSNWRDRELPIPCPETSRKPTLQELGDIACKVRRKRAGAAVG